MESLKSLLNKDCLKEAEDITQMDCSDPFTASLGFALMQEKNARLRLLQEAVNDTTFSMPMEDYVGNAIDFGFQIIYYRSFTGKYSEEEHFILFHPKYSIILNCDSFMGSRNQAKCYFNYVPYLESLKQGNLSHVGLSGMMSLYESFDARESLRYKIQSCAKYGTFKTKWEKSTFLWLFNHVEIDNPHFDYNINIKKRIAELPLEFTELIGLN